MGNSLRLELVNVSVCGLVHDVDTIHLVWSNMYMRGSKGGGGGDPDPLLMIRKSIGFLSNTVQDPLKIPKLSREHLMLSRHWHASDTPFEWRFAGGPIEARFEWYLVPLSPSKSLKVGKFDLL